MITKTTKISARISESSANNIKRQLDTFACKTITQFVHQAVEEKLERYTIGKLIEESITKQNLLNSKLESVLKGVLIQEKNTGEIVSQIAVSLAKISAGFNALSIKNQE